MLNSKVTRRGFLSALVGLAAAPALLKLAPKAAAPALEGSGEVFAYGVLAKGDVFTIEGVYALNPMTYRSTGQLQRFCVVAEVSARTVAVDVEQFVPRMVVAGPYQNVVITSHLGDWPRLGVPRERIRPETARADLLFQLSQWPPMGARILS